MAKKTLEVCDLYQALKADGRNAGVPCVILRLCGSNLSEDKGDLYRYTWDKTLQSFNTRKKIVSVEVLADKISLMLQDLKSAHLFITGGEPLMQQEEIVELLSVFKGKFKQEIEVEIETNGTIVPCEALTSEVKFSVNVHLGSSMSGSARDSYSTRVKKDSLDALVKASDTQYVFSVLSEADYTEIEELIRDFKMAKEKMYIRPANNSLYTGNWKLLYTACMSKGYRLSPKFDLQAFGSNINILNNKI